MKKQRTLSIFAILMTALLVFSGSAWAVPAPVTASIGDIRAGFRFERDLSQAMNHPDVKYLRIVLNTDPDTRVAETRTASWTSSTW